MTTKKNDSGFTDAERAAIEERAAELKAASGPQRPQKADEKMRAELVRRAVGG